MRYLAVNDSTKGLQTYTDIVRLTDDCVTQRFDFKENKWINDDNMAKVFFGEVECDTLSEKEAETLIRRMANA